jgi:hypothetical protein
VIGIFFDLSKAYDVINHEILLDKLDYYGIRGKTKLWLESYLSYCSQYVEIAAKTEDICNQNYKSTCKAMEYHRDPFWDPLCFYINEFHTYIYIRFADPITVFDRWI